ncbi:MAG TPA: SGNH/GDSL hydrolase family protein [Acetobacteraceae bacterium]|nr:SGNH/GDSL hydrolase family protein [Acetobacteraceae bacterium]
MRRLVRGVVAGMLVLGAGSHAAQAQPPAGGYACPAAPVQRLDLPRTRAAILRQQPVVIVAFGSSSTFGAQASDPGDSYPAELQDRLNAALPGAEISVLNRGINGQDAKREDARMTADVLAVRPQAVIWQVGANAALRGEKPAVFTPLLQSGLARLRAAGIDVVLMDNQRSVRMLASPTNHRINAALSVLARRNRASLFSRDRLMRLWAPDGTPPAAYLAADGIHMNDRGYACLAQALGRSITAALREDTSKAR